MVRAKSSKLIKSAKQLLKFVIVTFNRYSRSVHGVGACNEGINELALACIDSDASSSYNANLISSEVMDKREVKVDFALQRMRRGLSQPKRTGIWTQWAEWERCDEWRYLENSLPDTVFRVRECVDPAQPEDESYLDCPGQVTTQLLVNYLLSGINLTRQADIA